MALSKEQWRKMYGIREPKDPADPDVVGRRKLHETIARWEIKWLGPLHVISGLLAFLIVLLPAFSKSWKSLVTMAPIIASIQKEFSSFGGIAIFLLAIGLFCYFYPASKIDGKNYSEYGYPINMSHVRSSRSVINGELYPRTKIEERIFWIDSFGGLWGASVGWFALFGGATLILNSGRN